MGLGGTSCLNSANPSAQGNGSASCHNPCQDQQEQNNSCFPGSPSRTQCTFRGQWGWGGSWDEARGQTALGLLELLPEQEKISDSPVCLGWGFGCAEPGPHVVAPCQPCCTSQGCSCSQIWLSSKCQRVWTCPGTSALGGVRSCSHPGPMGWDVPPAHTGTGMQSRDPRSHCGRAARERVRDSGGKAEPEDSWTRVAGGAFGVPRERHPRVGSGSGAEDCGVSASSAALRACRGPPFVVGGGRERCPRAPQAPSRREQRPACVRISGPPAAPNPASPALPGAPSPRFPSHPTSGPRPLSPAALCLRLSRCPAAPRLPSVTPNIRAAPAGEPRAVPSRSPPSPRGCQRRRLPQPRENLPRLSPSHGARPLLGRCPGRRGRAASGRAGSSRRESAQAPGET